MKKNNVYQIINMQVIVDCNVSKAWMNMTFIEAVVRHML